jgi:hypothetical protein
MKIVAEALRAKAMQTYSSAGRFFHLEGDFYVQKHR